MAISRSASFLKTKNGAALFAAALLAVATLAFPCAAMAQANSRWAWGDDFNGQLGDNKPANYQWIPVGINATTNNLTSADDISAGYAHSLALKSDGTVWSWGWNHYGQLGTGGAIPGSDSNVPAKITGLTGMTAVAAGGYHSLALTSGGAVKAWGHNNYGQLGNGVTLPGSDSSSPVTVSSLTNVKAIAAGGYHSLALKNDGTVWAWGFGLDGELGDGLHTTSSTRVQVSFPNGTPPIKAIAAGLYHSLAIDNNGTVWAWGRNVNGQLGDGSTTQRNSPVQVHVITGIVAIAGGGSDDTQTYVGGSHSLALKNDGSVWAWGYNANGQLGNGTYADSDVPVEVLTGAKGIAAGGWHSMAISSSNGTVAAWGLNNQGQIGNGTLSTSGVPVMVSNITGMTHIAAGGYHSLAISCTAPGAPTLNSATGDCNGVNLAWTAGSGCTTAYNVYSSANTSCPVGTLTKIAGPITATSYSDTTIAAGATRTYVVRAACDAYGTAESPNSNCLAGTRLVTPAAPAAPGVADVDPCALSGVSISWSAVTGATGYDMQVDGSTVVSGVTSPYTYSPGNSSSHSYQVRSKNTCGSSSWSTGTAGTDAVCPVPGETSPGTGGAATGMTWSSDKGTISWQAVSGTVSGYRLYKGVPANLPNLLNSSTDSCTRYDGTSLSYTLNTTTDAPSSGGFYWFLVDAYNGAGEGSAGNARIGTTLVGRTVNSSGACP